MSINDENMMISIIKQYYELGISQEEIASREFISKSTVSRIINRAMQKGYVKIKLDYPVSSSQEIEAELVRSFSFLKAATVVPAYVDDYELRLKDVCKSVSADLKKFVQNDEIIGLSWGRTMEYLARTLEEDYQNNKTGVSIVQLNGFVAGDTRSIWSSTIVERFQKIYNAQGYLLPVPVLVDNKDTAQILMQDSRIRPIFELARQAQVAVFSIGTFSSRSVLFERGLLGQQEYDNLCAKNAVGDICSRYFDVNGKIVDREMGERTLSISLRELATKRHRMAIAVGDDKVQAIVGALRTGAINRLYTDEVTARAVICQANSNISI